MDTECLVEIQLDKPRHLLLDLNAMVLFEQATSKSLWQIGLDMTAIELRAFLWACLWHEDNQLTPSKVGELVTMANMKYVTETITRAYSKAMPTSDKVKGGEQSPPLSNQTG